MRRASFLFAWALLACAFGGCATEREDRPHGRKAVRTEIYCGAERPDGRMVGDREWNAFLREAVTPRFPAGYTVLRGEGRWRGADGRTIREESRVIVVLHPPDAESRRRLDFIAEDYRERFQQESVLTSEFPVRWELHSGKRFGVGDRTVTGY